MVTEYLSEIISFVAGLVGGSLITIQFTRKSVTGSGRIVDQSRASAHGDIVGGDKNTVNHTERK